MSDDLRYGPVRIYPDRIEADVIDPDMPVDPCSTCDGGGCLDCTDPA